MCLAWYKHHSCLVYLWYCTFALTFDGQISMVLAPWILEESRHENHLPRRTCSPHQSSDLSRRASAFCTTLSKQAAQIFHRQLEKGTSLHAALGFQLPWNCHWAHCFLSADLYPDLQERTNNRLRFSNPYHVALSYNFLSYFCNGRSVLDAGHPCKILGQEKGQAFNWK